MAQFRCGHKLRFQSLTIGFGGINDSGSTDGFASYEGIPAVDSISTSCNNPAREPLHKLETDHRVWRQGHDCEEGVGRLQINYLELLTVLLALKHFLPALQGHHVYQATVWESI